MPPKPDKVVLEIITTASGMVYPKEGDLLDMRLYESGRFEYDDYPEQKPPTYFSPPITRKESRLNPEDVRNLINLAEQPDFLSAEEKYPGILPHIDDQWVTTIKFTYNGREKIITAVNLWDFRYAEVDSAPAPYMEKLRKKVKYPPSLLKLFVLANELKAKTIGKS
jgi:hypothetical protein